VREPLPVSGRHPEQVADHVDRQRESERGPQVGRWAVRDHLVDQLVRDPRDRRLERGHPFGGERAAQQSPPPEVGLVVGHERGLPAHGVATGRGVPCESAIGDHHAYVVIPGQQHRVGAGGGPHVRDRAGGAQFAPLGRRIQRGRWRERVVEHFLLIRHAVSLR
jgi:hypothetical protein